MPIAHNDGNYYADPETLERLTAENRIAFHYCMKDGSVNSDKSPNGSQMSIAGILSKSRRVLGMMPHPEELPTWNMEVQMEKPCSPRW